MKKGVNAKRVDVLDITILASVTEVFSIACSFCDITFVLIHFSA